MPAIRRSVVIAAVIAIVLVAVGMWLVVAGWPMETSEQIAMLDLAQLPMSAAVLVAIVEMTYQRRVWLRRPRTFVAVFGPGAVLFLAGIVMLMVAFALPARHLVGGAQLLIWTGLGIAFAYLAVDSVRRELGSSRTSLQALRGEEDLDDLWFGAADEEDEDPADEDPGPLSSYGWYQAPPLFPESAPGDSRGDGRPGADPAAG